MSSKQILVLVGGLIVVSAIVGVIVFSTFNKPNNSTNSNTSSSSSSQTSNSNSSDSRSASSRSAFGADSLASFNGKNNARCYVAIDGTVYDVTSANGWSNGVHTASGSKVTCGKDESALIAQAPHGRRVLADLPVVGSFAK